MRRPANLPPLPPLPRVRVTADDLWWLLLGAFLAALGCAVVLAWLQAPLS